MKLIEHKVELIQQQPGLVGMYKHIETCARTCYKSEDKITEDSYKKMYDNLVKRGHLAMLEHGTIYLYISYSNSNSKGRFIVKKYNNNQYSKVTKIKVKDVWNCYITTNLRVIQENNWDEDLVKYICEPTEFHERRITLKFTTNIGVTREGNRHRVNSIAEESTRYCNYTKEKHGNGEINIAPPIWLDDYEHDIISERTNREWVDDIVRIAQCIGTNSDACDFPIYYYGASIVFANICYNNLIRLGWSPQQAREVLPLATKSEVVYTAFASDWKHWFDLRLIGTTGKPHPNMEQVAWLAQQELIKNNLWDLIYDPNNKKE